MASPPPWLAGSLKLPGFKGETAGKGDGVIADPATELDPTIRAGTPMATPSGSDVIDGIFKTPPVVDVAKALIDYVITSMGGGNGDGAKGNVTVETGATPDANEVRAGQGLANSGYDVSHQPTANSQGTPGVRTADLSINGVGQVDVYTPTNTNPNSIVRNIEAKFDQADGVIVQANLSEADMTSIAARTWGKPNGQGFNTIFFQDSNGQVFRFDRPTGGK